MTDLDRSLDEIAGSRRTPVAPRSVRNGVQKPSSNRTASMTFAAANTRGSPRTSGDSKIIISGLPYDVTEGQLKELFETQIGRVKRCYLTYGPDGHSKGIATVIFPNTASAQKAYEKYNGLLMDKSRKLKVEVIVDPASVGALPLVSRLGGGQENRVANGRGGKKIPKATGRARTKRAPVTVDQLDAEMDNYRNDGANA